MTRTRRRTPQEGIHVGNSQRWTIEMACRRLCMSEKRGIAELCRREGVPELCWLTHERGWALLAELKALGEEAPLSPEERELLAWCADQAEAGGRREEAEAIRAGLALDLCPVKYPV